jgi:hypothetical protein
MAKALNKTTETKASVDAFLAKQPEAVAEDCRSIIKLMRKATGEEPRMWGPSIVGFGTYHYKYDSGREGDFLITGFSPRKAALTLYLKADLAREAERLKKLGKHKVGGGCLYIKKLSDVDLSVLEELVVKGVKAMAKQRIH